ncbi:NADP-dependent oxidoreductase [Rugosimonospora africana]|uniref:Putative oxidoreductase n=1 Tax=Rugosimonospora africana TaxID=556532 RepID=A0A8J3QQP3_9ACTN|nr:NADP-dependent oxidoreductase [Rugosimonospora africana]GIH14017.1 putative oxidoreductase [Rugosimonospora africana]
MARAVRFDRYGGTDVLYVADVEVPAPRPGEVLVAVRAAGINPGEAAIRDGGLAAMFPATFPSGEGSDLAGVVEQVGDGAGPFAAGDEVMGWTDGRASHAEYVAVPADHLIRKPAGLSWEVAGSLYVVGVTAYACVRAVGAGPGDTIAVSAAAGGVGSVVVQLLKVRGADVIGIASDPHHAWLSSIGAMPISYGDDLAQRIREEAPSGVDAFIDTFGPEYVRLAVELGVARDRINTVIAFDAAKEYGVKSEGSSTAASVEVLAEVAELVASGRVRMPIAATYPLDEVRAAFEELEKRHTHGKIVLVP